MKRLLLACLALLIASPVLAGINQIDIQKLDFDAIRDRMLSDDAAKGIGIPQPPGYYMDVSLLSITTGMAPTFQVAWGGPGWFSIFGGCPVGNCVSPQYSFSNMILPPGGAGIFTHSSADIITTYTSPGGQQTTYPTHATALSSQPNNLHLFMVMRYDPTGGTGLPSYAVFWSTSIPGTSQVGPGRNYVATVEVPGLRGGDYRASAFQRLLHYRTYTTITTPKTTTVPCKICVGGTPEDATEFEIYLVDYAELTVNARIPTTSSFGLLALGMVLAGAGLLVLSRRRVRPVA